MIFCEFFAAGVTDFFSRLEDVMKAVITGNRQQMYGVYHGERYYGMVNVPIQRDFCSFVF